MTYEKLGWVLAKASYMIIGSFVFSYIFWGTKKWLDSAPKKKKK